MKHIKDFTKLFLFLIAVILMTVGIFLLIHGALNKFTNIHIATSVITSVSGSLSGGLGFARNGMKKRESDTTWKLDYLIKKVGFLENKIIKHAFKIERLNSRLLRKTDKGKK